MQKWLIIACCFVTIVLPSLAPQAMAKQKAEEIMPGPFRFTVVRVIDGDTFQATIPVWLGQDVTVKVRLEQIDAPEMYRSKCAHEKQLARQARDFVANWLQQTGLVLENISYDKYGGRVNATVRSPNGETLGAALRAAGLARPYKGRRESWCN